ncbi:aminoacyl-histidine dipeptidase [bacterium D16-51]|nr:aminoacyl-histidine dipeptidase [bacterium D16-59]RKI62661.1 aminoacyl-histidine dipeptidase [bacterium D16-51]
MGILSNLEPIPVFSYFEEICSIPHGSGNTKAISDYCVRFAREHHLDYIQDNANNVIIFKDGTTGYENAAPVILQGHLDMVCEKEQGCNIDFTKEGLQLQLENGCITAKGTTLGGDDGIAVAYALAILAANDIPHPPLEAIFTVDEEIGMLGAAALDCSPLKGRIMLNIDSEEEGYLLVSCAGGASATAHLPVQTKKSSGTLAVLQVAGLLGGHSGVEIDKGRANACILLGRSLYELKKEFSFELISVNGGLKDNAIPREAAAVLLLPPGTDRKRLSEALSAQNSRYQNEYKQTDASIQVSLTKEKEGSSIDVMTPETADKVITALCCLPNGILYMSHDIEGLVQTSLNLGILSTKEDIASSGNEVSFTFSVRSSISSQKEELIDRICCLLKSLGGSVTCKGNYPAWEYRQDSPLRDLMISVFEKQYGKKPVINAIHAGLECGIFSDRLPGLDCVSFGPDIKDIHTPKETLDVESVQRTWKYILEILKELN